MCLPRSVETGSTTLIIDVAIVTLHVNCSRKTKDFCIMALCLFYISITFWSQALNWNELQEIIINFKTTKILW